MRIFFDTGAPLSYLREECVQGCAALGEVEDFHPLLGRFRVPTFSVPVSAWGQSHDVPRRSDADGARDGTHLGGADGILGHRSAAARCARLSQRQKLAALMAN